ncbi:MAG: hypothetical protein Kow0040_32670 [Thermogutta sp.]
MTANANPTVALLFVKTSYVSRNLVTFRATNHAELRSYDGCKTNALPDLREEVILIQVRTLYLVPASRPG